MKTLLLVLAMVQAPVTTDSVPDPAASEYLQRFPIGEELVFDAMFGFIKIGQTRMRVVGIDTVRGVESLHLQFRMEGSLFSFKIDNQMDSWVGLDDFKTRRFVRDNREGGRRYYNAWSVYPDSGFFRQDSLPVDSITPTVAEPLDDASFFYFVRTTDLTPGERYEYDRHFRPDRNPVILEVVGPDTIDVPAGRFSTVVIRPIIKGGGIFAEDAQGQIWISDDERRLPVQIKTKLAFATITMRLKEIHTPDEDGS